MDKVPPVSKHALEDAILTLLCFGDDDVAADIASRLPDNTICSYQPNQIIARAALQYIERYKGSPKMQLEYLLEQEMHRGEEGALIGQQLKFMQARITI